MWRRWKATGGRAEGTRVEFGVGEAGAPLGDVFVGEFERVEDCADHGVDIGVGAAEPGFDGICIGLEIAHGYNPFRARKARTTSATSWCLPSTASFMACMSSALSLPAS